MAPDDKTLATDTAFLREAYVIDEPSSRSERERLNYLASVGSRLEGTVKVFGISRYSLSL